METSGFRLGIEKAFSVLQREIAAFNAWWPAHVVAGQVWPLAVCGIDMPARNACEGIEVSAAAPRDMVEVAQKAIAALHLEPHQDPKTTLRVPGWFALSAEPTAYVERINQARNTLSDLLDVEMATNYKDFAKTTRMNLRGKLLRGIIRGVSMRHTFRKLHAFDTPPLVLSFIWVGSSTSHTLTNVGAERARLTQLVNKQAKNFELAPEETPLHSVLYELDRYRDHVELLVVRAHAPHPRALVHYEKRGRYDAMPHANLPIFFYNPIDQALPQIRALPPYELSEPKSRGRNGTRMTLLSARQENRKLYLYDPNLKSATSQRLQADVVSTYATPTRSSSKNR